MTVTALASKGVHYLRIGLAGLAMFQFTIGAPFANAASQPKPQTKRDSETTSPIKHVIVIIGENRSFDHVFATYVPKSGETVNNLLSEGIITAGRQQERDSRTELLEGATALSYGYRQLPAGSADQGISQQRTACTSSGRSQRREWLFHRPRTVSGRPIAFAGPVRGSLGNRIARVHLLSISCQRRHGTEE